MQVSISTKSPLTVFLEMQGFVLLDGGLATELEKRGHNLNTKLWSAGLLNSHADTIRAVHHAYLEAGDYFGNLPGHCSRFYGSGSIGKRSQISYPKGR